jgi:hypothetical protein
MHILIVEDEVGITISTTGFRRGRISSYQRLMMGYKGLNLKAIILI